MADHIVRLKITGMTCGGCVKAVENALIAISGVDQALIDLQEAVADVTVTDENITPEQLVMAVKLAGYDAQLIA